jgi:hypothetical protein
MPNITLTIVRHRGQAVAFGRNVALQLLLEKSTPKKASSGRELSSAVPEGWVRSSLRLWGSNGGDENQSLTSRSLVRRDAA